MIHFGPYFNAHTQTTQSSPQAGASIKEDMPADQQAALGWFTLLTVLVGEERAKGILKQTLIPCRNTISDHSSIGH